MVDKNNTARAQVESFSMEGTLKETGVVIESINSEDNLLMLKMNGR